MIQARFVSSVYRCATMESKAVSEMHTGNPCRNRPMYKIHNDVAYIVTTQPDSFSTAQMTRDRLNPSASITHGFSGAVSVSKTGVNDIKIPMRKYLFGKVSVQVRTLEVLYGPHLVAFQ